MTKAQFKFLVEIFITASNKVKEVRTMSEHSFNAMFKSLGANDKEMVFIKRLFEDSEVFKFEDGQIKYIG